MAQSNRDEFISERDRIQRLDDQPVRDALLAFADALDPEYNHASIPKPASNGGVEHESKSNNTAKLYLKGIRLAHQRGLDILNADAKTVNDFMRDLVADPSHRRFNLVGPPTPGGKDSPSKPYAKTWQAALRSFYRFATEPGAADTRPDVAVEWPADEIIMFSERSKPKHDGDDQPEQADLDAMREACLAGQNTRRDRAFLEVAAGTGQRVTALVTLRIGDVHLDDDVPHVMLNPEIDGDGDKGAIAETGRWKPITSDIRPIRQWIENHPLRDPDTRAEHGAPDAFEDCYLFIGSLSQHKTDAAGHMAPDSARTMLDRRKADTADLTGVKTVTISVNPHNWRHYAYTQSQELPIDESTRRKVFGWAPGSDTGETVYGHIGNEKAGRAFGEAWADHFGDDGGASVAEQVLGQAANGELTPEVRDALVTELVENDEVAPAAEVERMREKIEHLENWLMRTTAPPEEANGVSIFEGPIIDLPDDDA